MGKQGSFKVDSDVRGALMETLILWGIPKANSDIGIPAREIDSYFLSCCYFATPQFRGSPMFRQ